MELVIQRATPVELPSDRQFRQWVETVLTEVGVGVAGELTLRLVDEKEGAALNRTWRKGSGATNVLSFPYEPIAEIPLEEQPLGDLVICVPVVRHEAEQQGKRLEAHWAHMVVHGVLHLLGHDHIEEQEAVVMEALERQLLSRLGYPDHYRDPLETAMEP